MVIVTNTQEIIYNTIGAMECLVKLVCMQALLQQTGHGRHYGWILIMMD